MTTSAPMPDSVVDERAPFDPNDPKPTWRGWIHAGTLPAAVALGVVLVCLADGVLAKLMCAVYFVCSVMLFGGSALYHRFNWGPKVKVALKRLDHDIYTLGPARIGRVSHAHLRQGLDKQPHLARLLWFSTLLDAVIHREWILKLEDLSAAQRVAHLFCEICRRLEMVGLGDTRGFSLPLTQAQLASMCGTTAVHMSRALRRLSNETGATFRHGRLDCPDPAALAKFCEFDPSYLYGPGELQLPGDYAD